MWLTWSSALPSMLKALGLISSKIRSSKSFLTMTVSVRSSWATWSPISRTNKQASLPLFPWLSFGNAHVLSFGVAPHLIETRSVPYRLWCPACMWAALREPLLPYYMCICLCPSLFRRSLTLLNFSTCIYQSCQAYMDKYWPISPQIKHGKSKCLL